MPIPKRIIQMGRSKEDLSADEQDAVARIQILNPDFDYVFFDDDAIDRFVEEEFPEYEDVLNSFEAKIQKFDLFRYLAVHRLGGFYFDLDVILHRGLSDLTECDCVFPFEKITIFGLLKRRGMLCQLGNYAFGAAEGSPFLAKVIEGCVRCHSDPDWAEPPRFPPFPALRRMLYVYCSSGPGLVSRVYADNPELREEVEVLFPAKATDAQRFGQHGAHLCAGSWKARRSRLTGWWIRGQNAIVRRRYGARDPRSLLPANCPSPTHRGHEKSSHP